MPPAFMASFAKRLDDHCALKVVEARSGMADRTRWRERGRTQPPGRRRNPEGREGNDPMSRLDDYIEKLNCLDEAERIYAAEDIGHLNTRDGVVALLERLGKKTSRAVRDVIFQALIRIDADEAIEGSIRLFGSEDPQIRNQEPRSRACSSSWRTNANCISDCWRTNLGCGPAWFRARGIVPTVRGGVRRSPGANRDRRALESDPSARGNLDSGSFGVSTASRAMPACCWRM